MLEVEQTTAVNEADKCLPYIGFCLLFLFEFLFEPVTSYDR